MYCNYYFIVFFDKLRKKSLLLLLLILTKNYKCFVIVFLLMVLKSMDFNTLCRW